jgi:hypothetical protein
MVSSAFVINQITGKDVNQNQKPSGAPQVIRTQFCRRGAWSWFRICEVVFANHTKKIKVTGPPAAPPYVGEITVSGNLWFDQKLTQRGFSSSPTVKRRAL